MPALSGLIALVLMLLTAAHALAAEPVTVGIGYLALTPKRAGPQVALDPPLTDEGVQGARLALMDNQTTGRFLKQAYALHESLQPDADAVLAAARAMLAHDGPALLDVVTARQELAMPPKIGLEQAAGFGLWVAKAVLDGRGTEVVDLARTNLLR